MAASASLIARMLVQTVVWLAITGALLFVSAGTLDWPQAWIFLAETGVLGLISGLAIGRRDPALLRERMSAPIQKGQKRWDKVVLVVLFALWMSQYVVIGLDAVRFGWSHGRCGSRLRAGSPSPWGSTPSTSCSPPTPSRPPSSRSRASASTR